jgi:hypothetical protein
MTVLTVWVVMHWVTGEGDSLVGIYATREAGLKAFPRARPPDARDSAGRRLGRRIQSGWRITEEEVHPDLARGAFARLT